MQFFSIVLQSALVASAAAAAIDMSAKTSEVKRADCVVNSASAGVWHEWGLSRFRTAFSGENTDVGAYCNYWHNVDICGGASNIQCWHDDALGWVLDASFVLGAGGDLQYNGCIENTRNKWLVDSGCRTG